MIYIYICYNHILYIYNHVYIYTCLLKNRVSFPIQRCLHKKKCFTRKQIWTTIDSQSGKGQLSSWSHKLLLEEFVSPVKRTQEVRLTWYANIHHAVAEKWWTFAQQAVASVTSGQPERPEHPVLRSKNAQCWNVESYFLLRKSLLKNQTTDFDVFPHQPGFRHSSSAEFKSTVFSHLRTCQWLNGTVPSRTSWCRRFQTAHFTTKSQRRRRPGGSSRPHQFSSPAGWPSFWKRCSLTHCYTSSRQLQRKNLPVYKLWHCRRSRFPSSSKCSTTNHWKLENQEPATNWRSTKTHHRSSWQIGEPS